MPEAARGVGKPGRTAPKEGPLPFARLVRHRTILDPLLAFPGRSLTIRELSTESKVPYATTWRLVEDLRALGVLRIRRVGPSRLVSINSGSPLLPDLERLRALRLASHRAAAEEFADRARRVKEVEKILLFGSVAGRGPHVHSDVDVAVELQPARKAAIEAIRKIAARVQDQTGIDIVPITMTPREFASGDAFARSVRAGELLYERLGKPRAG